MLVPFVGAGIVRSLGLCMRTNNYRIKFNVKSMKVVVFTVGGDIISIAHRGGRSFLYPTDLPTQEC